MVSKSEDIFSKISNDLIYYFKNGIININSFIQKITYQENNEFKKLMRIHFLSQNKVIKFIKTFPMLIKDLKFSTISDLSQSSEKIKGQIQWNKTIRLRINAGNVEEPLFIIKGRRRLIETQENLVLINLILVLENIIIKDLSIFKAKKNPIFNLYGSDLYFKQFLFIIAKNIHLRRIKEREFKADSRMIFNVKKSRKIIYRDAANILFEFENLFNSKYSDKLLINLFKNTFVHPESENVLFELYWVIETIKLFSSDKQFKILHVGNTEVATWESDEFRYKIYHNNQGGSNYNFKIPLNVLEGENQYLKIVRKSQEMENDYRKILFNKKKNKYLWKGRPDLILEKYHINSGKLSELIIGEVKNSENEKTCLKGLSELLDYINFIDFKTESIPEIKGILFTDKFMENHGDEKILAIDYFTNKSSNKLLKRFLI
jgi:hypothetical protein